MANMSVEVDIDDWEFLPDTGYYDFNGKKSKYTREKTFDRKSVVRPFPASRLIDIPSPEPVGLVPHRTVKPTEPPSVTSPAETVQFIDIGVVSPVAKDQETVSRVFFKKMKENEFADMKMDSPKASTNKGLKLLTESGAVQFEDKEEVHKTTSQAAKNDQEISEKKGADWDGNIDIWGWKVNGIGALCCVGVAAATTICIFILGSRRGNKQNHNKKIQFQIHSDDKRIKPVAQPENIMSQAIAAARDVPINGAIYFGGY